MAVGAGGIVAVSVGVKETSDVGVGDSVGAKVAVGSSVGVSVTRDRVAAAFEVATAAGMMSTSAVQVAPVAKVKISTRWGLGTIFKFS